MVKNLYFENYNNSMEQNLIEDLIIESIRMYGIELFYIPRTVIARDNILNEDDLSRFDSAHLIEMYIKNVDSFEGEGDFLSKFGLQIRDSMTLSVAQRIYNQEISEELDRSYNRPAEGDLIYFPLNKKIFEVMHVEHESIFYQMGALQTYDLRVELFEFSGERFNTGIEEIDNRFEDRDITSNNAYDDPSTANPWADNEEIEAEANSILDFSEENPFGEDIY